MLVHGYLLAPLFLIVPLMVSAVLAADAFAGEKERRTLEALLHLPVSDRDLFLAKLLVAFVPALAISWIGFICFAVVANIVGVAGDAPRLRAHVAVAGDDPLGRAGRRRARPGRHGARVGRARTTQEANQLGGAVILPLIFLAVGQATGLLLVDLPVAIAHRRRRLADRRAGSCARGATRFTRDQLAARL